MTDSNLRITIVREEKTKIDCNLLFLFFKLVLHTQHHLVPSSEPEKDI